MNNERYELRRMPLARGATAELWQGRDLLLGRDVAVKFARTPQGMPHQEAAYLLRAERTVLASVAHPGVPEVFDSGMAHGRPYLVMRLVRGSSLSDLLAAHGPLHPDRVRQLGTQLCAVLTAVHAAGFVHGDIRPANIMLTPAGTVVLVDFGLAGPVGSTQHQLHHVFARPVEVVPDSAPGIGAEPTADLYALGHTLRTSLAGEPGRAPVTTTVPPGLAAGIDALLATDPRDRPSSAQEARRALAGHVTRTVTTRYPTTAVTPVAETAQ